MLIGCVIRDEIQNHFQAALMRVFHEIEKILHRAEHRVNAGIVGDVVAEIRHRRGVNGADPDRGDAQVLQIRQPEPYAVQIANAVAVAVLKTARINLINHSGFPPREQRDILHRFLCCLFLPETRGRALFSCVILLMNTLLQQASIFENLCQLFSRMITPRQALFHSSLLIDAAQFLAKNTAASRLQCVPFSYSLSLLVGTEIDADQFRVFSQELVMRHAKPTGEGSGLGFDICKKILDKHQGKIDFESQPGKTTFRVWLPISQHTNESSPCEHV